MTISRLFAFLFGLIALIPFASAQDSGDKMVTRADMVVVMVEQMGATQEDLDTCFAQLTPSEFSLLFSDVSKESWYAKHLCFAMINGLVRGYSDGSFRPDRIVNFAEASKLITRAFSLSPAAGFSVSVPWYKAYVETLVMRGAIPAEITRFDMQMNRRLMNEILDRIIKEDVYRPSIGYDAIKS